MLGKSFPTQHIFFASLMNPERFSGSFVKTQMLILLLLFRVHAPPAVPFQCYLFKYSVTSLKQPHKLCPAVHSWLRINLFILTRDFFYIPQDSLLKLKDFKQCFEHSEVALNEAIQQMINMTTTSAKEEWVATVTQLLKGIDTSLSAVSSILSDSSITPSLVRLTNNLIQVTYWACTGREMLCAVQPQSDTAAVSVATHLQG